MLRALLILAVLALMPLGMMPAGAMAATEHHEAAMAGHCQDEEETDNSAGFAQCTMACAAALPAIDAPVEADVAMTACPLAVTRIVHLSGLEPDIATPPPRLA